MTELIDAEEGISVYIMLLCTCLITSLP